MDFFFAASGQGYIEWKKERRSNRHAGLVSLEETPDSARGLDSRGGKGRLTENLVLNLDSRLYIAQEDPCQLEASRDRGDREGLIHEWCGFASLKQNNTRRSAQLQLRFNRAVFAQTDRDLNPNDIS